MKPRAIDHRRTQLEAIGLLAILAVGTVLRFHSLAQRGLVYWDEGKFALEGVRLEAALHGLFGGGSIVAGKAIGTAKPTHALLIALSFGIFGVHDYAALFMNAACSVLAILVTFLIARRLFGPRIALVSTALLAVSEYDVIYARSALSESDANLLFLLGVLAWVYGSFRQVDAAPYLPAQDSGLMAWGSWPETFASRLIGGLLMGAAFTTNYRLIVYVAAVVGFDLIWTLRVRGIPVALRRTGLWTAGLLVTPLVWTMLDLTTRGRGLILFRSEQTGGQRSYLSQVVYQLHEGRQSQLHFNPGSYLHWYVLRSGWPLFVLLLLGISLAVWRGLSGNFPRFDNSSSGRSGLGYVSLDYQPPQESGTQFSWWAMLAPIIIPYLIYIFAPFIVARNLDAALPFAAVLSAVALVWLVNWIWYLLRSLAGLRRSGQLSRLQPHRSASAALLLIFLAVLGALDATASWRLGAERSGYARAATFIQAHGHGKALVSSEILVFYLRGSGNQCRGLKMPGTLQRLAADAQSGFRYAALDHASGKIKVLVRKWLRPLLRYPAVGRLSIGENILESEIDPPTKRPLQTVTVYRVKTSGLPAAHVKADFCSRERV